MAAENHVGMRGGNRGIEDGAQQRASVGHGLARIRSGNIGCRYPSYFRKRKPPQVSLAGVLDAFIGR
jgi:hypothetical protein